MAVRRILCNFRLDVEVKAMVEAQAKRTGSTQTEIVEAAIRSYFGEPLPGIVSPSEEDIVLDLSE